MVNDRGCRMRIEKIDDKRYEFPCIIYKSDEITEMPALIVQLHGSGDRGNGGGELDKVLCHGFPRLKSFSGFRDCLLVMPQCPSDTFWVARIESLKVFIDKIIDFYKVDKDRVYLTGLSMGGFGTWYMAMAYPDMFAAIAPCCGGGMPWNASVLTMPVWAFHGAEDTSVLPVYTIDMVEKLKKTNSDVRFSLYDNIGHNIGVKAYSDDLLSWLLSKKRKSITE